MITPMRWDAIIFDMDGVIIDSEPLHYEVESVMFQEFGLEISADEHAQFLGMSSTDMWQHIQNTRGLPISVAEMVQREREMYQLLATERGVPEIPGSVALIRELAATGVPIAVASSAPMEQIAGMVAQTGIEGLFSALVSGDEVPRSKPDPAIYLETARRLNVSPLSCAVIEDSAHGFHAATSAGMHCIRFHRDHYPTMDHVRAALALPGAPPKKGDSAESPCPK